MSRFIHSIITLSLSFLILPSLSGETLRLESKEIERLFLEQNRELIAEKMNISIDDARIAEAKVWENPELSIGDINFWKKKPVDNDGVPMEYSTQFSVELSQMIAISSRRSKMASVEKANKQISLKEYEQFLLELKIELRSTLSRIIYLEEFGSLLNNQISMCQGIVTGYGNLYKKGDISLNELMRIESYILSLNSDNTQCDIELNTLYSALKNLLFLDPAVSLSIVNEENIFPLPQSLIYSELLTKSLENNPELETSRLYNECFKREISYQKSLAIPDLNVSLRYDRYGGVWKNYFGIGVGMPIPVLNRNKSGVKVAKLQMEQNEIKTENIINSLKNEMHEAINNYTLTYDLFERSVNNESLHQMDTMLERYNKSLLSKEISMIEYIDYIESARETKDIIKKTEYELRVQLNRIEYLTGGELKNEN